MTIVPRSTAEAIADDYAVFTERADAFDAAGQFPLEAVLMFAHSGLLGAPVPPALGGQGMGSTPAGAEPLAHTLQALGAAWLPLARVFEGHVNALRLIFRYGTAAQASRAANQARTNLFGIWATETRPVRLVDGVLLGAKSFASGAGSVTRPLVTVVVDGHERLAWLELPPGRERIVGKPDLLGMRGAGTAAVELDGIAVTEAELVGAPGDYMRQPEISLGAWRALPGLLGGLVALTDLVATDLSARQRDREPLQLARFGQMMLACETASLWVQRVATAAEADDAGEDAAALVKLGRHAVDQACTLVLDHARRAVGLGSFVRPNPVERVCRDIDTYRRQPALDEVLLEAARHRLDRPRSDAA